MALMEWDKSLSVSVAVFDQEHKRLIALLNKLHGAMECGEGKEILSQVFAELINYTATHFKHEEKLMLEYDCPDYPMHKKEHDDLVVQVLELQKQYEAGATLMSVTILDFLRNWISNHIQKTDAHFGPFFNSKGIY